MGPRGVGNVTHLLIAGGLDPVTTTADEFAAVIKADIARWAKVVREAGIRAE